MYCKSSKNNYRGELDVCVGGGVGWTTSFFGEFTSALGCGLSVSVRWTSLAVLVYQFKSRILLFRGVKELPAKQFQFIMQSVSVSAVEVG